MPRPVWRNQVGVGCVRCLSYGAPRDHLRTCRRRSCSRASVAEKLGAAWLKKTPPGFPRLRSGQALLTPRHKRCITRYICAAAPLKDDVFVGVLTKNIQRSEVGEELIWTGLSGTSPAEPALSLSSGDGCFTSSGTTSVGCRFISEEWKVSPGSSSRPGGSAAVHGSIQECACGFQ